MLDYLERRLDANDLMADEALALLVALHTQLGRAEAPDPGLYPLYGRLMQALKRKMPAVHVYVVSAWSESRRIRHATERCDNTLIEDTQRIVTNRAPVQVVMEVEGSEFDDVEGQVERTATDVVETRGEEESARGRAKTIGVVLPESEAASRLPARGSLNAGSDETE